MTASVHASPSPPAAGVHILCPRWGAEQSGWERFLDRVAEAGYDGVEWGVGAGVSSAEVEEVLARAARRRLLIVAQHHDTEAADFARHRAAYAAWLDRIAPLRPHRINSQTGLDHFSFDQNRALLDLAGETAARHGVAIAHETHRRKFSYAAHVTRAYLERIPSLRLTLDVSHWVCVAESFLEDQPEALALAIARTDHLHARVGHPEGPQIPDPRAPEWRDAVERHLAWWDAVAAQRRAAGAELLCTVEFGPFPYLPRLPFTEQPVADQWELNLHMLRLLRGRYGPPNAPGIGPQRS
ncbi:MAG TPA: TIM barrel protein [Myxococcaceae bacterium]|nr:TIM barrel protein [Myxococcaceae bacterium]